MFADWNVGKEYKLEKILGQGSYGQVAQAINLITGKRVAIKRMLHIFDDVVVTKRTLRELVILRKI